MGAEYLLLNVARAMLVVEVEPGLADTNDPLMFGELRQFGSRYRRVLPCLVRVHADGAPNVLRRLGNGAHRRELVEARAYGQHRPDPCGVGACDNSIALGGEIRKIEMAVA